MNYTFSSKFQNLKPSAIREILKYSAVPGVIALSAGNPSPAAFPKKQLEEIGKNLLAVRSDEALQYGLTEGYAPLRAHIAEYMKTRHRIGAGFDGVMVTNGAQQVMELAVKTLCNEGDTVICENPSFIGSLNAFRSLGARLCGVPVQADGMDTDALDQALAHEPNVRFIYTIPNFQNPTGATLSFEKRKKIYALAQKYNVLIVEDNPYGDLRYEGAHIPAVKSLDEDGRVIYAGSFSKVVAPGLRVGFTVCPAPILKKMIVAKQVEDVHTAQFSQMLCHEFITKYDFETHLESLRTLYRQQAQLCKDLIVRHLVPHGVTLHPPQGGLFMWCTLPEGVDMPAFCTKAVQEKKVAVVPGSAFLPDETQISRAIRINFSTPTKQELREGIARLEETLLEMR